MEPESHPFAGDPVFDLHLGGKMETVSTVALTGRDDLSLAYTPGVARVCEAIAADPGMTQHYTWVPNVVAVVSDGTAVLGPGRHRPGRGDAGDGGQGRAVQAVRRRRRGADLPRHHRHRGDHRTVQRLAPSFGGINLEDISAPPLLRDRGPAQGASTSRSSTTTSTAPPWSRSPRSPTRCASPAAPPEHARRHLRGGAAGVAVARILLEAGVRDLAVIDRRGVLNSARSDLTPVKAALAGDTADNFGRTRHAGRRDGRR